MPTEYDAQLIRDRAAADCSGALVGWVSRPNTSLAPAANAIVR